jgi:hypothetical protein
MIHFTLGMTPESTITVDALRQQALAAVIDELIDRGYTVNHDDRAGQVIPLGTSYRLEPGPATLTLRTTGGVPGSIEFLLEGDKFGMAGRRTENDPVVWMRLWTLGHRLGNAYKVVPHVSAPDIAAGPSTLLPN